MLKIEYVPRHIRLGVCCSTPEVENYQEIKEIIPIVSDDGTIVETRSIIKRVKAVDAMAKYKVEDFRLSKLQKDGVPLKVVNINRSSAFTIDELNRICQSIDDSEKFVNKVLQERKERENWFNPPINEKDSNSENSN